MKPRKVSAARNGPRKDSGISRSCPAITAGEKRAIDRFLRSLKHTVDCNIKWAKAAAKQPGGEALSGQIQYWVHVSGGLKWALAINKQRKVTDA
jgi:hypothetical protein